MKRILSIFLALVMALGALPTAAFAADSDAGGAVENAAADVTEDAAVSEEPAGTAGDNIVASGDDGDIHWSLDDQGTLTISGQGRVPNYYSTGSGAPWKAGDLREQIKNLVVEEGITYLGQFAFSDCRNLTAVSLPSTLEEIGQQVFQHCSGLLSVDIPDSVHTIGKWPFEDCTSLQSAHLPAGIGTHSDVSKRILPEGLFNNCTSLATVNVPYGVKVIGPLAFCKCASLESIDLPDTVTALGSYSFNATGLTSLILPDNITTIGELALMGNTNLTTLKLPANLKTLGNDVLNDSAVTELTIPGSVKVVGEVRQGLFAPAPNLEKLVFEDGVETINGAFLQAVNLKEIHIPATVTSIADGVFVILHPDCIIYGEPGSYAETYAAQQKIPFNGQPVPGHTLSLTVQDENGQALDSGYAVRWYAGDVKVGEGTRLTVTDTTLQYSYELILEEPLLYDYLQPQRQNVTLAQEGDTTAITAQLAPLPELTATGRVLAPDGIPASGAQAFFTQDFGGGRTQTLAASAGADGVFTAQIKNVPTQVRISAPGCYDKILTVPAPTGGTVDLGDCLLTALPSSRVTLALISVSPALPGQTPEETALTSIGDLRFTVTDGSGAPVNGFTVQYPYILFGSALPANTALTITAVDAAGAAASAQVILDENGCGEAALRFVQQGKFTVQLSSDAPTTLLLFNADGGLVQAVDTEGQYTSRSLPAGTYQAALLRRTSLLKSVPSLSTLGELGLTAGTDYAQAGPFTVGDGVITDLGSVTVPHLDEARLAYTDPDRTGTTVNFTSAAVGKLITLRAEYALKPEHAGTASGLSVAVELPQGLKMEGAATVDGKEVTSSRSSQTISIPVTGTSGVVRLCFLASQPGDFHIPAYLRFTGNGAPVAQPLGSARLTVTAAKLYVPATTGSRSVTASGLAQAGSTVQVYDNGVPVGTAAANDAGKWSLSYTLNGEGGYTYHDVYGVVQTGSASYRTETAQMLYDASYVGVSRVTMYNTAEGVECETVFDYLHPNQGLGYYVMQQPSFSFAIEFTGTTDRVSDVKLNVFTEDGGVYTYDTTYDPESGRYLASVSGVVPVNVGVEYRCASDDSVEYSGMSPEGVQAYLSQVNDAVEDLLVPVDAGDLGGNVGYVTMGLEGSDETFDILLTPLEYSTFTPEVLEARNFLFDEKSGLYYVLSIDEHTVEFIIVDSKEKTAFSIGAAYDLPVETPEAAEAPAMLRAAARGGTSSGTASFGERFGRELLEKVPLPLVPSVTAALDLQDLSLLLERKHTEMWKEYFNMKALLDKYLYAACPGTSQPRMSQEDGTRALHMLSNLRQNEDYRYRYWRSMLDNVYPSKIRNALAVDVVTCGLGKIYKVLDALPPKAWFEVWANLPQFWRGGILVRSYEVLWLTSKLTDLADNLYFAMDTVGDFAGDLGGYDLPTQSGFWDFTDVNGSPYYLSMLDAYDDGTLEVSTLQDFILRSLTKCPEDPTPEDPEGKNKSPENDKNVKRDPSGFVCEAVASNRLEGVTATLYYKASENDTPVQWDGSDYGETNPKLTDANGVYRWDVPRGWWQVQYSKDGYTSAQSAWLPVPPPQTEVNIALVSTEAPTVQSVTAYQDGVRLAFSQYLKPDSVTAGTVTVLCGGKAVTGTIAPVNAEAGFSDPENQYASVYVFTPDEALSGAVTVQVQGIESYNGKTLTAPYQEETPVTIRPTGLTAPVTASAALGSGTLLTVRLQPAEAAAGKTLRVTSDLPSVAAPEQGTISFGQDGAATVKVNGKLLGTATVTFTLEGSDLPAVSTQVTVAASAAEARCAAVQASIPSGSTVAAGTMLTLTTDTQGAAIYYTLDKSCPCVTDNPARKLYTGPIPLTEDVFLIAYAVKEGCEDSPTAKYEIHVTSSAAPIIPPVTGPAQPAQPDPWTNPYADVPTGAWYYDQVAYVTQRGLMTGVAAGRFAPDGDTTRAMIWTILGRLSGAEVNGGSPWYAAARTWAMDTGVSDGTNALNQIRRQELAAMLYRFADSPAVTGDELALLHSFSDGDSVSAYARSAMAWAVSNGIVNGMDGRLAPMGFATRAQTAAMLTRYCLLLGK